MYSRWFNLSVVLLWLATMGWLVWEKFLPPLLVGDPPDYSQILAARHEEGPVCWDLYFNNKPIGRAYSITTQLEDGFSEVRSEVHIRNLNLMKLVPGLVRKLVETQGLPVEELRFDAETTLSIDAMGHLMEFNSKVNLPPLENSIAMRGLLEGGVLRLSIRSGALPPFELERRISSSFRFGDGLSPQTQLPGLREGQTWKVQSFNRFQLFQPQGSAAEVYTATVEGTDILRWDDRFLDAWLVVYRSESGLAIRSGDAAPAKLWVRKDGTVLKQQVMLFNAEMTFVRVPDPGADRWGPIVGLPPRYGTIVLAQRGAPAACWDVQFDGHTAGWAVASAVESPEGGTLLEARTHLDESPLVQFVPGAARALMRMWDVRPGMLQMDVRGTQRLDPRDLLETFESSIQAGRFNDAATLDGKMEGKGLTWSVRQWLLSYQGEERVAPETIVADLMLPQDRLPGVDAGQTWPVAAYCLLRAPNRTMQLVEASVGEVESILWHGSPADCFPVVYRSEPNQPADAAPAMLWVDLSGNVLRQEVRLPGGLLVFTRLSQDRAIDRLERIDAAEKATQDKD